MPPYKKTKITKASRKKKKKKKEYENANSPSVKLTHLHKPVVRWGFIRDINFGLHVIELHVFTLINKDELEWIRTLSQHCVDPTKEPVGVEHLSVVVLPQWRDPERE